jgi:hypothetical protein
MGAFPIPDWLKVVTFLFLSIAFCMIVRKVWGWWMR